MAAPLKTEQVITLLTPADKAKLDALAEANQCNRSEMVRDLIRAAITPRKPYDPTLPVDPDGFEYEMTADA